LANYLRLSVHLFKYVGKPLKGQNSHIRKPSGTFTLPPSHFDHKISTDEDKMKLDFSRDDQLTVISKKLPPDQIVPINLTKLARSKLLKITATGTAINRAASLALDLTKGSIAKEPIGIEHVTLLTNEFKEESTTIQATALNFEL